MAKRSRRSIKTVVHALLSSASILPYIGIPIGAAYLIDTKRRYPGTSRKKKPFGLGLWKAVALSGLGANLLIIGLLSSILYIPRRVEKNYGREVERRAREENLPAAYLKALIALECSGVKDPEPRYEAHVFRRLARLRSGERPRLENLTPADLEGLSDATLKNLASSWGPFQIMGYKVTQLGIVIEDLRGEDSIRHGVDWIQKAYGHHLRQGRSKDAFHAHNTGRDFPEDGVPTTTNPDYVKMGTLYEAYFKYMFFFKWWARLYPF